MSIEEILDAKEIIHAAAQVLVDAALRELQADPHQWSDRPCGTCRTISALIGKPFGCYLYQQRGGQR